MFWEYKIKKGSRILRHSESVWGGEESRIQVNVHRAWSREQNEKMFNVQSSMFNVRKAKSRELRAKSHFGIWISNVYHSNHITLEFLNPFFGLT
jgi:hypothetical protein